MSDDVRAEYQFDCREAAPNRFAADGDGVIRVGATRVTLDTVIAAYREGMTAEAIVGQYPPLRLADVESVIGYLRDHPAEVDEYLRARQTQAARVRAEIEARFNPAGVKDRLLARRASGRQPDVGAPEPSTSG